MKTMNAFYEFDNSGSSIYNNFNSNGRDLSNQYSNYMNNNLSINSYQSGSVSYSGFSFYDDSNSSNDSTYFQGFVSNPTQSYSKDSFKLENNQYSSHVINNVSNNQSMDQNRTRENVPLSKPKRRTRIRYTQFQLDKLEELFKANKYPDARRIEELADSLNLTFKNVTYWFQNRRSKHKPRN